ncbi:hypothetical protein [Streptomyces sp. NBC_00582]|uniref:hypothetical protein n=1 Tax=Streptomyces sp. NBC_00582 TaxID=2975783 RepID=UPI002E80848D|nr:hypothetical protein [Streptomyces sp. NBC_00582]WUB60855.1 hypothetical protein OG852_10890 [Streptomyces sp. NBC_00582]
MPDVDDVLGVLTEQIETRFQMPIDELRQAVSAAPQASPEAATIVRWHGLLSEAQQVLDGAEDVLAEALARHVEAVPDGEFVELPEHVMQLANTVNVAHTVRDGRAMTVRHLLDPQAIGNRTAVWRSPAPRRGPALPTTAPSLPAAGQAPVRGAVR